MAGKKQKANKPRGKASKDSSVRLDELDPKKVAKQLKAQKRKAAALTKLVNQLMADYLPDRMSLRRRAKKRNK